MDLSFGGSTVGLIFLGLILLILGIIFFLRSRYRGQDPEVVAGAHSDSSWSLASRNKYPEVNPFRLSKSILLFGVAASLLLTLLAFSWTRFEKEVYIPEGALELDEEIEIEPPRTAEPPPPPPPPPPPVIEEVPEEEIEEEEQPVFEDQTIEEDTEIVEEPPEIEEEAPPPPPPPPPPPKPEVEEIFKIVEQRPRFPGCENEAGDNAAKEKCAQQKMLEFLYKNIKYPAIAKENGIEGSAVISFVVEKDGSITDTRIVRDVSGGCGKEALRVVNMMNNMPQKWTPGKQRGRAVRVQYNLPVKFKLE